MPGDNASGCSPQRHEIHPYRILFQIRKMYFVTTKIFSKLLISTMKSEHREKEFIYIYIFFLNDTEMSIILWKGVKWCMLGSRPKQPRKLTEIDRRLIFFFIQWDYDYVSNSIYVTNFMMFLFSCHQLSLSVISLPRHKEPHVSNNIKQ